MDTESFYGKWKYSQLFSIDKLNFSKKKMKRMKFHSGFVLKSLVCWQVESNLPVKEIYKNYIETLSPFNYISFILFLFFSWIPSSFRCWIERKGTLGTVWGGLSGQRKHRSGADHQTDHVGWRSQERWIQCGSGTVARSSFISFGMNFFYSVSSYPLLPLLL